ncbi:hypothetical protein FOCC_FOCC012827 [Frankliniella occidentalis]|nr:hypothetical protein FOCC_FOCC012827 [Frankliniella occidentalis]
MPHVPPEKYAKPILDKIRLCTDLLNYERYLKDCEAGKSMCLKPVADPEVILELLKRAMLTNLRGAHGFLIDGFPRDEDQVVAFEKEQRKHSGGGINLVPFIHTGLARHMGVPLPELTLRRLSLDKLIAIIGYRTQLSYDSPTTTTTIPRSTFR